MSTDPWYQQAVIYQVYVRSFADGDGDGTGDIAGIRSRLPYLRDLGVDGLWVNPWYESPLHDGGYDVADYRKIDPRYGTVEDAKAMIDDAHELGLRVLVDLVPNHTSFEHAWFEEAVAAPKGHPSRDRYHILPGAGERPPNNWRSVFGGPAWRRLDDGDWYLHLFDWSQPDLNWTNPEVQEEFEDVLRFWLDLGADGFRVDVAHGLAKDMDYPDERELTGDILRIAEDNDHPYWDRDDVHIYIRQWREVLDSYDDRMMVAEAWVAPDRMPLYLRPDEYHQSFGFQLTEAPWEIQAIRKAVTAVVDGAATVGALPTWTLSNHDVVRHATRYGLPADTDYRTWLLDGPHDILDADLGRRRARAAVLMLLALPGSIYLYQGEELGLPEVWDLPLDVLDDPVWENSGRTRKGRDGCRVPIPWAETGPSLGFGEGEPWLPQPPTWAEISVAAQQGAEGSFLELYRAALAIRRDLKESDLVWRDAPEGVLAFSRGSLHCWVNFAADDVALPEGVEVLLNSRPGADGLDRNDAVWFR